MFTQEQLENMVIAGLWQLVKDWMIILKPMLPGIIAFLLIGLIGFIIEKGFLSFIYQYLILIGNSKKTAKKKVSKAKNIIDSVKIENDIHNTFK
ncbi:hypothetical protein [[Clostridium] fimetarium]|uniref:Uncharacterized protein n=1 Tax=[Clostridium] fimetarium TaxID=99656 RepID=A0A1I0QVW4_9FIRM|nr:hypothetical protein [[Clostridium] fimetarium]SEW31854.1 hypothetical protein SAMN05421659_109191 [[Clostridium] fimetarium]